MYKKDNDELNDILRKREALFQDYSVKCNMTPVENWSLYTIYYNSDIKYTQNTLSKMWNFPKQTVNYAIKKLVNMGYITLEKVIGERRSKYIILTYKGKELCEVVMKPLIKAELSALEKLSQEEREVFLKINRKYYYFLEKEINELYKDPKIDFSIFKGKDD